MRMMKGRPSRTGRCTTPTVGSSGGWGSIFAATKGEPSEAAASAGETAAAKEGGFRKVPTPGKRTIEEVSAFLAIDPATLIKTLLLETSVGDVAVLVSGAHEVNEIKVKNHLGAEFVRLAGEERVRQMTGAPSGFAGPVGLSVRTIADHAVLSLIHI